MFDHFFVASRYEWACAHFRLAEKLDPAENVEALPTADEEEEDFEFPFNVTSEDKERILQEGVADNS